jgi:carboxypeptidase C (cathepsin A)
MSTRLTLTTLLAGMSLAFAGTALSAEPTVITHHTLALGGRTLPYTAEVGRLAIRDVESGEPHGYMGYTAYLADAKGTTPRPVTFIWNGGPGANSALLHFRIAGPRRYRGASLADNPESWLTASDLVMVDPIGTGFSRPAQSQFAAEFYSTRGDVDSVTEFVRAWRLLHGVETSPVFLVGESWGAGRAASVAYALESRGVTVNGLVLISGGWGLTHNYGNPLLRDALRVVDMASTALYYGKTPVELGKDPAGVRSATEKWVREVYVPALARADQLTDSERLRLQQELSLHTGIAAQQIDPAKLKLSPRAFREGILKSEGQTPSQFDLRERNGERPAFAPPVILRYFRHDLGFKSDLPYVDLEPLTAGYAANGKYPESVGERWNYATIDPTEEELKAAIEKATREGGGPPRIGPPLPAGEEAIELNPRLRVLVAAGMYDGFQPCAADGEIWASLPPKLKSSMTFKCYHGGHAMYLDEPARLELTRDVVALMAAGSVAH